MLSHISNGHLGQAIRLGHGGPRHSEAMPSATAEGFLRAWDQSPHWTMGTLPSCWWQLFFSVRKYTSLHELVENSLAFNKGQIVIASYTMCFGAFSLCFKAKKSIQNTH